MHNSIKGTYDELAAVTFYFTQEIKPRVTDQTQDSDNEVFSTTLRRLSDYGLIRVFSCYPIYGTFTE